MAAVQKPGAGQKEGQAGAVLAHRTGHDLQDRKPGEQGWPGSGVNAVMTVSFVVWLEGCAPTGTEATGHGLPVLLVTET